MIGGFRQVIAKEGAGALLTGFGPTAAGYFLQGGFKFGGYELFKKLIIDQIGVENAVANRTAVYLGASAVAEFFADVALCPLEATRIRLVSNPSFASGLVGGAGRIFREEGLGAFYAGFGPILFKQVPYTMTKFVVFEKASETIFASMGTPKSQMSSGTVTSINLASGLIAGIAAAIISQPADTLLSKVNKTPKAPGQSTASLLMQIAGKTGISGLFGGIGARIVMVGTLTSGQFVCYNRSHDTLKSNIFRVSTVRSRSNSELLVVSKSPNKCFYHFDPCLRISFLITIHRSSLYLSEYIHDPLL